MRNHETLDKPFEWFWMVLLFSAKSATWLDQVPSMCFCLNARSGTMCKLFHPEKKSVGIKSACELGGLDIFILTNNSMCKKAHALPIPLPPPRSDWAVGIHVNWGVGINDLDKLYFIMIFQGLFVMFKTNCNGMSGWPNRKKSGSSPLVAMTWKIGPTLLSVANFSQRGCVNPAFWLPQPLEENIHFGVFTQCYREPCLKLRPSVSCLGGARPGHIVLVILPDSALLLADLPPLADGLCVRPGPHRVDFRAPFLLLKCHHAISSFISF